MDLKTFLVKRLLLSVFVLFGVSIVIFTISRVVPGDPARMALGERATQEAVDTLRHEMHLDQPLVIQYVFWIKGVLKGDLGKSLTTNRPVMEDVKEFLPASLELSAVAAVIMMIFSILFGTIAAVYRDRWPDSLIRLFSYMGVAIPSFVLASLLLLFFGYVWQVIAVLGRLSNGLDFPSRVTGFILLDSLLAGDMVAFWDGFQHLIVPAVALACGGLFQEARIVRTAMTDNMGKDYLMAHKGYGIPNSVIMRKYLLKPSLIPAVSVMGLDIASLMGGAFLVELIFNWPGLSRYGTNAMLSKDLNVISAVILIYGMIFVVTNIIVDLVVAYLDPRIRLGGDS